MPSREEYDAALAQGLAALLVAEHRRRAGIEVPKNSEPATVIQTEPEDGATHGLVNRRTA